MPQTENEGSVAWLYEIAKITVIMVIVYKMLETQDEALLNALSGALVAVINNGQFQQLHEQPFY